MLVKFRTEYSLLNAMRYRERRQDARKAFLHLASNPERNLSKRMLSWFNDANTEALADVLEGMTADEIAVFMMEVVRVGREI